MENQERKNVHREELSKWENQEIIYSRIKIQYYRIALACKRVRRRRGKSVAEKIFCSVMPCSADLIL